jgi:hypothetical protein
VGSALADASDGQPVAVKADLLGANEAGGLASKIGRFSISGSLGTAFRCTQRGAVQ